MEGAVSAHRHARYSATGAPGLNMVMALDEGKKFANQEILITHAPIARINVEAAPGGRRGDDEFTNFAAIPQVLDDVPAAAADQGLLVAAKSVEIIQNGEAA